MKLSQFPLHTQKKAPKDESSLNASLLIRAGFIEKLTAGVYNFLPLGLRVLKNIEAIVRQEMNELGGQEILMAALQPKQNWEATKRWQTFNALFKVKSQYEAWYALGPTHEEIVTPLAKKYIFSYKDLPLALYQIQTKFRDEPRPKSGLLRTREFVMKDLYSFHQEEADLDNYYEKVKEGYLKIYEKLELPVLLVEASGGTFSKYSHEFQVITEAGEDTIYHCSNCGFSQNEEIIEDSKKCPRCHHSLVKMKGIEVGNIFKLKDKYSRPFNLTFLDQAGKSKIVMMGCYGLGISRVLGSLVEVSHDERGIIWPKAVAPFQYHLVSLLSGNSKEDKLIKRFSEEVYQKLLKTQLDVLFDERLEISNGEKLVEADLLGLPQRLVISPKLINTKKIEIKNRKTGELKILSLQQLINYSQHEKHLSK
ncbi:MAG: prolyl-tRNA synthetase [Patescibacteria group bacterium]|nr:prolyl-tRNA synthetase [Patescibacteria group bacterium]